MAEIKGEYVKAMDSLVNPAVQGYCREKSGIDVNNLDGQWVPAEQFNAYIEALRERTGETGPYIVGTRIIETMNKIFGVWNNIKTLEDANEVKPRMYLESNRGTDAGYYQIPECGDNHATIITTSPLDEGFHLGVYVGLIRMYKKRMAKGTIEERMATHGRTVYKYTW